MRKFFARISKGYVAKATFDALATSVPRVTLRLEEDGISIREFDGKNVRFSRTLWDVRWPRDRFEEYECHEEFYVTLNAKHLQSSLRSVKKKDSLSLFVTCREDGRFGIIVEPTGGAGGLSARSETILISANHVPRPQLPALPEYLSEDEKAYGYGMVVKASDFQKVKKMASTSKSLEVKIQESNYASFSFGDEAVVSTSLAFGEERDGDSYSRTFDAALFAPLLKLPGMTEKMSFYAPKDDKFPLLVGMQAISGLGEVKVFVKDQGQTEADERERANLPPKPKSCPGTIPVGETK